MQAQTCNFMIKRIPRGFNIFTKKKDEMLSFLLPYIATWGTSCHLALMGNNPTRC